MDFFSGKNKATRAVIYVAALIFIFIPFRVFPRDTDGILAAIAAAERAEKAGEEKPTLLEKTLRIDIDTAGYFELIAWCKRLGLPEKGTKEDLADRLYDYYELTDEEREEEKKGKEITITSAKTTEYFTVEQIEEDYIVVKGDVVIEISDDEENKQHKISAREIYFNQNTNILTAEGDVVYTLIEDGREETFFGKSLNFSLDTWEGVFFKGVSVSEQQIEDDTITFRYYGDTIYRSEKDAVRLENGIISSSKPEEPYYRIKAKKIWVLAPGEWAILGASLYVGEVPLLYIPFFFKNRDKVVFRPAMGFRDRAGFYLQTSTYFLGESREDEEETLSFLQLGETDDTYMKKELKGIYLRTVGEMSAEEKKEKQFVEDKDAYAKFMFDAYSRLGLFSAFEFHIGNLDWLEDVFLFGGIARSRDIYIDTETGWYTPYWSYEDGTVRSRWHSSWVRGEEIPLRFGIQNNLSLSHPSFSLSTNLESYSDPGFTRDFFERSEETDWQEFIGIDDSEETGEGEETQSPETAGEESGEGEAARAAETDIAEKNRLEWHAKGTLTPDADIISPYISTATINRAEINMNWKTKDRTIDVGNVPPEELWTEYAFPEKKFYYPDTMLLPAFGGTLSGQLVNLQLPREKKIEKDEAAAEDFPGKGIRSPWDAGKEEDTGGTADEASASPDRELRVPENRGPARLPIVPQPLLYRQQLTYNLVPAMSVDHRLDSETWDTQEDIDYSKKYSLFYTQNSFDVTSQSDFYNSLATIKDTISLSGTVKDHFNRADSIEDEEWDSFKLDDYQSNAVLTGNNLLVTIKPLLGVEALQKSNVSYNLNVILFKKEFKELNENNDPVYEDSLADWEEEYVNAHSLSSAFIWTILKADQKLTLTYIFPPLLQKFTPVLDVTTGPFNHYLKWDIEEEQMEDSEEKEWKLRPMEMRETFTLQEYLVLQQTFLYNFEYHRWAESTSSMGLSFFNKNLSLSETFVFGFANDEALEEGPPLFDHPYSSVTELKLWWFSSKFTALNTKRYEIDPFSGWVQKEEEAFQPESLQFALDCNPKIGPFWKNRINLDFRFLSAWKIGLLQYTNNTLTLGFDLSFEIHEFIKINFGIASENTEMYRYFQKPCDEIGIPKRSFITDLLKSFNIFTIDHRTDTLFNAKNINLSIVHKLRDWDLSIDYSGSPTLETDDGGIQYYDWDWSISFFVQWNPIPEIKRKVRGNDDDIIY